MMHQFVWLIVWALCTFYESISESVDAQQKSVQDSEELQVSIPLHDYDSEGRRTEPRIGVPEHVDVVEVRRTHSPTMHGYWRHRDESDMIGSDKRRLIDYYDSDREETPSSTKHIHHRPLRRKKRRRSKYTNQHWRDTVPNRKRKRHPAQHIPPKHVSHDFFHHQYQNEFFAEVEKFRKEIFEQLMNMIKSLKAPTARSLNSSPLVSKDMTPTSTSNRRPGSTREKSARQKSPVHKSHSSPARRSMNHTRKPKKKEPHSTTSSTTATSNIVTVSPVTGLDEIELSAIKPSESSSKEIFSRIHPRDLGKINKNSLSMLKDKKSKETVERNSTITKQLSAKEVSLKVRNISLTSTKAPDLKARSLVEKSPTKISLPLILQEENMSPKRSFSNCSGICPVSPPICLPCSLS